MPSFAAEVDGVEGFPGEEEEIEKSGVKDPGGRKDEGGKTRDEANGGCAEGVHDRRNCQQALQSIENERVSLPPGVPIKRRYEEEGCGEAESIEDHHPVHLN